MAYNDYAEKTTEELFEIRVKVATYLLELYDAMPDTLSENPAAAGLLIPRLHRRILDETAEVLRDRPGVKFRRGVPIFPETTKA